MLDLVLFLVAGCLSGFGLAHHHIMVVFCEYPPNFLQSQSCFCQLVDFGYFVSRIQNFKGIVSALLLWLVNGLNNDPDTAFVMRGFSGVTVKEAHSLLCHVFLLHPELDHAGQGVHIHEFYIVNMPELLPLDDYTRRDTFVAHGLGVRFVVAAVAIHLVLNLRGWQAVTTLYFRWVHALALKLLVL